MKRTPVNEVLNFIKYPLQWIIVCFILWKVSQTQRDQGFSGAFWAEKTESGLIFRLLTTPAKRVGVERTGYLTTPTTNFELKFLEN